MACVSDPAKIAVGPLETVATETPTSRAMVATVCGARPDG
jgi:hypothetical protein